MSSDEEVLDASEEQMSQSEKSGDESNPFVNEILPVAFTNSLKALK